jgi:predicted transposase/invertase (TIGR01784 family)
MEFHLIELPKLPTNSDGSPIYDWAKFISSENRGDFEMLAKKSVYLDEAYKQLDVISQDQQKRLEYTARQKAIYDYNTIMHECLTQGIQQGVIQRNAELVKRLESLGYDDEKIKEILS